MTKRSSAFPDDHDIDYARYYDRETHLWVEPRSGGRARCGFDPLGAEISGDIVAVSFEPVGTRVERGGPFGSLEAAKFVGPLQAPITGIIREHNGVVVADPGLLNADPREHWLVEIEPLALDEDLALLLHGETEVRAWLTAERRKLEREGLLAT